MSMNFGREQALLRQRLAAKGSPQIAAAQQQDCGDALACLGAPAGEVAAAAADLAAAHPQMGRAQMTAFVRTLWQSKVHELRAVGVELLAHRSELLEPADLPFVEGLLRDSLLQDNGADGVAARLAGDVLGAMVARHKKLWKDLRRLAAGSHAHLRRAAIRASRRPLAGDAALFARFAELVEPLLADADPALQRAIDDVLAAAAVGARELVADFATRHGRRLKLPRARTTSARKPESRAAAKPAGRSGVAPRVLEPRRAPERAGRTPRPKAPAARRTKT